MAGAPKLATAADVIAELNSGYVISQAGPLKEINELSLDSAATDAPRNTATAVISVGAFCQDLYGNMRDEKRPFTLTLEALEHLAEAAPRFRPAFSKIFTELSARLEQDHAAYKTGLLDWCDSGLPTQAATSVMKPLRFRL